MPRFLPSLTSTAPAASEPSSQSANPLYWKLISAFERRTGVPIVLNTSFNENEPIVNRPEEALDLLSADADGSTGHGSHRSPSGPSVRRITRLVGSRRVTAACFRCCRRHPLLLPGERLPRRYSPVRDQGASRKPTPAGVKTDLEGARRRSSVALGAALPPPCRLPHPCRPGALRERRAARLSGSRSCRGPRHPARCSTSLRRMPAAFGSASMIRRRFGRRWTRTSANSRGRTALSTTSAYRRHFSSESGPVRRLAREGFLPR